MQISKCQNYNYNRTSFRAFNITQEAKNLALNCPEWLEIAHRAEKMFKNSKHIDFNILDKFIPQIIIKSTGDKLTGGLEAKRLEFSNGLRVFNKEKAVDFVLPTAHTAKGQEAMINYGIFNATARSAHIAELLENSAREHHGRFLI